MPQPRTYHSHRERQHRRILDSAERLFDQHGIDRVTMADIISATGIRASTMYQYFSNKDDIVWAILGDVFADSALHASKAMETGKSALDKISALLHFMADGLSKDPARVRFLAQFDALYARHWTADRLLSLESQISPQGFSHFSSLIRDGIADGSLRPDLDPELTMHAVINTVIAAQRRLASLGSRVEQEYGKPIDALFRETLRIILFGLRATDTPVHPKSPKSLKRKRPS